MTPVDRPYDLSGLSWDIMGFHGSQRDDVEKHQ